MSKLISFTMSIVCVLMTVIEYFCWKIDVTTHTGHAIVPIICGCGCLVCFGGCLMVFVLSWLDDL